MLKRFLDYLMKDMELITAGLIVMNGGYYRPSQR
jgi:hypothetical protein